MMNANHSIALRPMARCGGPKDGQILSCIEQVLDVDAPFLTFSKSEEVGRAFGAQYVEWTDGRTQFHWAPATTATEVKAHLLETYLQVLEIGTRIGAQR